MNIIKKDSGKFLVEEDYQEIIESIVEDIKPQECIERLLILYKAENPSFIEKLLYYSHEQAWLESFECNSEEMNKEYTALREIYSEAFANTADTEKIDNAKLEIEQIEVKYLLKNKGIPVALVYTKFYLEVLSYIKSPKNVADDTESLEVTFKRLDTIEKLYLLQLLVDNQGLDGIYSAKNYLITILSLITGIKETTIEGNLKKYNNWYKINANLRKSPGELLARKKSIEKILIKINTVKNDPIVKEIVKTLEFKRDRFDT